MEITPDQWDKIKRLFDAAVQQPASDRAAVLAQNCPEADLRQEVEKLLRNHDEAGSFLSNPALESWNPASGETSETDAANESAGFNEGSGLSVTATSVEAEDPMIGRHLGAYRLVRRVGQGGMAAVFLAVRADDEYRKQVAVKLVQPGLDSRDLLNRFRNERQTLAGLDHPNIVKLLDGGSTTEGLPFLVMDYVEGSPIDEYCDQHKLSVDDRLHLFGKVCAAVQYAHQKLVVHRDLKPSNILVVAEGTPKLLDFGIAKVLNLEPSARGLLVTQTGTRCMTPAYASPEQMRGKPVTSATDIYSLGVVLYELLTGHRPYRLTHHTPAEMERAICEQEPETPSTAISRVETDTSSDGRPITKTPESVSQTREGQPDKLRRRLRGDLDNIVMKALQKEPERRYASVEELARDIERHLQHLPVKARPSTYAYRASKFFRRHRIEVSAAFIVLVAIAAAASFAFNALGLRERFVVGAASGRIQSRNTAPLFNPKGWVSAGSASIKPVVSCESLAGLDLPDTNITSTQSIATGSFTPAGADPIQNLPAFCRVEGVAKPTKDSAIRFEVWVPSSAWNGRFRGVGNGGFAGTINYDDMVPAVRAGYATASTDTGHRSDDRDALWAIGHPQKVVDFGYRAVHEMTNKAKAIIRAFYGQDPKWSYFEGCSNGGREALMEGQRFPEDYQGILAGAPAIAATRLLASGIYNAPTDPAAYIPAGKIPAISEAVLAACDAHDGVTDGILNDPRQCHFEASALLCKGADSNNCLTSAQVGQLKKIYVGLQNSKGEQLFPGYPPGGEPGEEGWAGWITGMGPGQGLMPLYGLNYFRNMVFENPAWDYRSVTAEKAVQIADRKNGGVINVTDPDLSRFKARGGKLIVYHGWSDAAMTGLDTINYYDSVAASMGLESAQSFVRLYMAPGMQHCYLGPGPNLFGQFDLSAVGGNPQHVLMPTDPEHDITSALEQWVEKGIAPTAIIATKYVNDLDPSQGVKMTRPLCPYPEIVKYKGTGDTNEAANFVCSLTNSE